MRKTICLALAATMLSAVTFTRTYNKQEVLKGNLEAYTGGAVIGTVGNAVISAIATYLIGEGIVWIAGSGGKNNGTNWTNWAIKDEKGNYIDVKKCDYSGDKEVRCSLGAITLPNGAVYNQK